MSMADGRVSRPGRKRPAHAATSGWDGWLREPRNAVWLVLGAVLVIGGGRRLVQVWRARGAVARLDGTAVDPAHIAAVVEHGRAGLMDLFRLLGAADTEAQRQAAGHALSILWARDDLIAEEEKGLVRRGFTIDVRARKRFPRALRAEIPVEVAYGVPFLREDGGGVGPTGLEWSHRVAGARRASLETFSAWVPGPVRTTFTMVPSDFESNGPHALVFQVRVRTAGLSEAWEMELPHTRFSFDFDPILRVEALLATPDDERAAAFGRSVRFVPGRDDDSAGPRFLPLSGALALRNSPDVEVVLPLPGDLAHRLEVEVEGVPGRFAAGSLVVSGPSNDRDAPRTVARRPIGPLEGVPADAVDRPGRRRLRVVLTADPHLAWADAGVRSLWPGAIETEWVEVEIVRR
jgi:hypothetical protein